jgi:drug/metabolite transporter (DMT)-like permease
MAVLLAFLASLLFAFGLVLQQRGTLRAPESSKGLAFIVQLFRHPVWLLGGLLSGVGFALQIIALSIGSLVVVQAIVISSFVFALPIGVWLTAQRYGRWDVIGASMTMVGLLLFLVGGDPTGGTNTVAPESWAICLVITAILLAAFDLASRRTGRPVTAALLGAAGGFSVAAQSGLAKALTHTHGGRAGVLGTWQLYALIGAVAATFVYQQRSLRVGVLAPALAAANAANLVGSVILGLCLFAERLGQGPVGTTFAVFGLVLVLAGIVTLVTRGHPPAMSVGVTPSVEGALEPTFEEATGHPTPRGDPLNER